MHFLRIVFQMFNAVSLFR